MGLVNPVVASFAVVRSVPSSYENCVRTNTERIDVALAKIQHREYCSALQRLGHKLIWVKTDDSLPDSCFVEDTAIIVGDKAVICNMSVKSRTSEVIEVARVLEKLRHVCYIRPPATIDGGDVMIAEDRVFIGLTGRTNLDAVNQVKRILKDTNLQVIPVKVRNVLHLKSACTYIGNDHVILAKGSFDINVLSGLTKIMVPEGEKYAADCLAVNGTILMAKGYPETKRLMENEGFQVEELEMSEFRKGEGAMTCLSIIL